MHYTSTSGLEEDQTEFAGNLGKSQMDCDQDCGLAMNVNVTISALKISSGFYHETSHLKKNRLKIKID